MEYSNRSVHIDSKLVFDKANFKAHYAASDTRYPDEVDKQRGFTQQEYETCIKVLKSFENDREMLDSPQYRDLRHAGRY
jgi:hypothetical protein